MHKMLESLEEKQATTVQGEVLMRYMQLNEARLQRHENHLVELQTQINQMVNIQTLMATKL